MIVALGERAVENNKKGPHHAGLFLLDGTGNPPGSTISVATRWTSLDVVTA